MGKLCMSSNFMFYIRFFNILGLYPYSQLIISSETARNHPRSKSIFKCSRLSQFREIMFWTAIFLHICISFDNFRTFTTRFEKWKTLIITLQLYQILRIFSNFMYIICTVRQKRTHKKLLDKAYIYFETYDIPQKSIWTDKYLLFVFSTFVFLVIPIIAYDMIRISSLTAFSTSMELVVQMFCAAYISFHIQMSIFSGTLLKNSLMSLTSKFNQIKGQNVTRSDLKRAENKLLKAIRFSNTHLRSLDGLTLNALGATIFSVVTLIFSIIIMARNFTSPFIPMGVHASHLYANILSMMLHISLRTNQLNIVIKTI